jgi:hypothetical protein
MNKIYIPQSKYNATIQLERKDLTYGICFLKEELMKKTSYFFILPFRKPWIHKNNQTYIELLENTDTNEYHIS